ncbi:hypothetical protein [Pedococcus bigeumensis]|uniref:hypothetical protein n=1 Tax=Pedococcus bigeumensis TaxID=433644 RepID=UPI002FEA1078
MTLREVPTSAAPRHLVTWAWTCVALVPVGLALSVVTLFGLATLLGVDLLPDRGSPRVSVPEGLLLGCTSTLVALAAPTLAVVLSVRAARAGQRSARAARLVSVTLLALAVLAFAMGVGTFGLFGLVVVGVVLSLALPRHAPG